MDTSHRSPFAVGDLVQVRPQNEQQFPTVARFAGHIGVVKSTRMDHDRDWSLIWISGCDQPFFEDELRSLEPHVEKLVQAISHDLELHGHSRCCLCGETVIDLKDGMP